MVFERFNGVPPAPAHVLPYGKTCVNWYFSDEKKSAGKGVYGAVKNVKERVFADVALPFVNNI